MTYDDSGAVEIRSEQGETILAPTLAVDATGRRLPAQGRITNSELVIAVDLADAVSAGDDRDDDQPDHHHDQPDHHHDQPDHHHDQPDHHQPDPYANRAQEVRYSAE